MPEIIDFYKGDGYSMLSLTQKMEKIPYNPSTFTAMFEFEGIATTTALIEIEDQKVSVLPTSPRGSTSGTKTSPDDHNRVVLEVPHIETYDAIMADALLGVRALGGTEQEARDTVLARKMARMKANLAATWEYHAAAAVITGTILDADGSTLYDLNTEFGITRPNQDFLLTTTTTDVRNMVTQAERKVRDALKGVPFTGYRGFCGRNFWDALISHSKVREAFQAQEAQRLLAGMDKARFLIGETYFELYDQYVGSTAYLHTDKAIIVPIGVANNFQWIGAPSDRLEGGVGTLGVQSYMWQKPMDDDKGIKLTGQTNPLFVVRRGDAICTCDKIS